MKARRTGGTPTAEVDARPVSRRSVLSAGLLGGAAAALGACATQMSPSSLPKGPDLVIGANLEMTGEYADIGQATWDALNIVANSYNNQGLIVDGKLTGIKVLPVMDNASKPKQAAAMMQTLVATPGITAVVGAVAGADAEAMSLLAEQHSVPMLSLSTDTAVPPTLMPGRPQFVFLLGPSSLDVTAVLINTITKQLHLNKITLLRTDDTYGQDGENAFLTLGGNLIAPGHTNIVRIDPAGKDPSAYSRAAHTVVTGQPDAVIVWGLGPVAGRVARALRTAGYTGALFFDPGAASDETINGDNHAAVNHAYVVAPRILAGPGFAATTPIAVDRQNFFDSYTLKHPVFSGLAVYGGDAVKLIAQAAIKAKSTNVLNIRQALTDLACEGIAGTYDFGSSNSGALTHDSLTVFRIDSGGWEPLTLS